MKSRKQWIAGIVLVGLLSFAAVFFYSHPTQNSSTLILYGNVDIREVELGCRVFGKVKSLHVEEGDLVRAGDLLAELDPVPYEEALAQAQAQVALARVASNNYAMQLSRREKAIIAQAVSQESVSDAKSSWQESLAALARTEASLSIAETHLEDTKLFAPSNGVILSRIREPGSVLQPGDPIYTLSLLEPIWIRAYVSEVNLGRVFPGMKAKVYTDTSSNPVYEGQVGFISPVAEFTPKNVETTDLRTDLVYRLRIFVNDPDFGLRQGMPVTVHLIEE